MTEQQFLIGLLRELASGMDISGVQSQILTRMEAIETQRQESMKLYKLQLDTPKKTILDDMKKGPS